MREYFPYDGERHAVYVSEDVDWSLAVHKVGVESADGVELATFAYSRDDDGTLLASVKWASDDDGVRVAAVAEGTGDFVTYDPPVALTIDYMGAGDTVETSTGGASWTSTYLGQETVDLAWGVTWEGVVHVALEGGDAFFAGEYWLARGYGPALMEIDGVLWDLYDYDWDP